MKTNLLHVDSFGCLSNHGFNDSSANTSSVQDAQHQTHMKHRQFHHFDIQGTGQQSQSVNTTLRRLLTSETLCG